MNGGEDAAGSANVSSGAPIDFDRLEVIRDRLATDDRFVRIEEQPEFAPDRLVCLYDSRFYPGRVERAHIEIAWYENGDFTIHYHETHQDGAFDHRWDRHPSDHNTRDHVHPGPDAPTPGDDVDHPHDWRDVLSTALTEIETRQRAFWETLPSPLPEITIEEVGRTTHGLFVDAHRWSPDEFVREPDTDSSLTSQEQSQSTRP